MENQKRTLIRHFRPTPPYFRPFPPIYLISAQLLLFSIIPPNSAFFLFFPFFPFSPFSPFSLFSPSRRSGYVLTTLRAYAYAAVLCAHFVARIRTASSAISLTLNTLPPLDAPAMCSLRCAHTPTPRCYVLTSLRAYAPPAPLFR